MAGNKELGRIDKEFPCNAAVVVTGIAANVFNEHIGFLTPETEYLRIQPAQIAAITITTYGSKWLQVGQTLGQLKRTDVAGMPYFVTRGEISLIPVIPIAVGV